MLAGRCRLRCGVYCCERVADGDSGIPRRQPCNAVGCLFCWPGLSSGSDFALEHVRAARGVGLATWPPFRAALTASRAAEPPRAAAAAATQERCFGRTARPRWTSTRSLVRHLGEYVLPCEAISRLLCVYPLWDLDNATLSAHAVWMWNSYAGKQPKQEMGKTQASRLPKAEERRL